VPLAARLEAADVPKPVLVSPREARPPGFNLDTSRAFLVAHHDEKALSPAKRARHNANLRIVSATGMSPTFYPETGTQPSLPPVVSVVPFKPVPDTGTGFKDYVYAQSGAEKRKRSSLCQYTPYCRTPPLSG
jgi:hypothetical protein